jgi:hypothetical protein
MTDTQKPVQRVTTRTYATLYRKARPIVVRIDQGDIIRFREKGRRQWFDLSIDQAFGIAIKGQAGFLVCHVPGPSLRKGKTKRVSRSKL